jgi:single-stranded-DNA-specific exonuclease
MQEKAWILQEKEDAEVERICRETGISRLLAGIFLSRGIRDAGYIKKFLKPALSGLYDPFLLKDMDKAVERIEKAVSTGENILIYGDYDVDGVTSTSILLDFLKRLGAKADFFIPDRMDDGYGLTLHSADKLLQREGSLIITVDCGITATQEVAYLREKGRDVIVTDHHECKSELPAAEAVVNPHRPDCPYPFKELSGVGVVFKLLHALSLRMKLGNLHMEYLDLIAVGTVADVVRLVEENRIIVKHGLVRLENTANEGLKALMAVAGLSGKPLSSWSVSFAMAPRINAAGRIGDAGRAVRLFTTRNPEEAHSLSQELNDENKLRQDTELQILQQVFEKIERDINLEHDKVIVVAGEGWHHGIIGIVASKVVDRYYRPCILLSLEEGMAKGSGRSIEGFNLFKALEHCQELLDRYGGHELAAGMGLSEERLPEFTRKLNDYAGTILKEQDLVPKIRIDRELAKGDVTMDSAADIELLAPFGAGNPSPVFVYRNLSVSDIRGVGDNKHLKLRLQDGGMLVDAIGFHMGSLQEELATSDMVDVACQLEINTWNSMQRVQLQLKDVKKQDRQRRQYFINLDKCIEFAEVNDYNKGNELRNRIGPEALQELIPERQDLAAVYQYLKSEGSRNGNRVHIGDLFAFAGELAACSSIGMNYCKAKKSIEIFAELGLLQYEPSGRYGLKVCLTELPGGKVNLVNSILYRRLQELKPGERPAQDWLERSVQGHNR